MYLRWRALLNTIITIFLHILILIPILLIYTSCVTAQVNIPYIKVATNFSLHGPLTRYVNIVVVHARGMPGTFSLHASRHVRHARVVTHVGIPNLWWLGKRSRHSRRMRSPPFYICCNRPIGNAEDIGAIGRRCCSRLDHGTSLYYDWWDKYNPLES